MDSTTTSSPSYSARVLLILIVLFGVGIRLFRLDGPPADHHWYRQYETAAMARNFAEGSMNILYPQVDWGGDTPGFVESEFPIYSYLVGGLYRLFGVHESLARGLNIICYALSALLLFRLVRAVYEDRTALFATAFYSVLPLSYFFTRTIQPDALASLASLTGITFFWRWTRFRQLWALALSALGIAIAVLIKPSNLYLGLPLLYLLYRGFGLKFLRRPEVYAYGVAVLLPAYLWYSHAFELWREYGNTLFRAYVGMTLPVLSDPIWLKFIYKIYLRTVFVLATPPGLILLVLGVFARPNGGYVLHWWVLAFAISMVIAPEPHAFHDYYQLPLMFCIAAFMGRGITRILEGQIDGLGLALATAALLAALGVSALRPQGPYSDPLSLALVVGTLLLAAIIWLWRVTPQRSPVVALAGLVVLASFWSLCEFFPIESWQRDRWAFGERVRQLTDENARVIFLCQRPLRPGWFQHVSRRGEIFYYDCPDFYLSHRKGWSLGIDQITPELTESLRSRGASYVCYMVSDFPLLLAKHPNLKRTLGQDLEPLEVTPRWGIFRLLSTSERARALKASGDKGQQ